MSPNEKHISSGLKENKKYKDSDLKRKIYQMLSTTVSIHKSRDPGQNTFSVD